MWIILLISVNTAQGGLRFEFGAIEDIDGIGGLGCSDGKGRREYPFLKEGFWWGRHGRIHTSIQEGGK